MTPESPGAEGRAAFLILFGMKHFLPRRQARHGETGPDQRSRAERGRMRFGWRRAERRNAPGWRRAGGAAAGIRGLRPGGVEKARRNAHGERNLAEHPRRAEGVKEPSDTPAALLIPAFQNYWSRKQARRE